MIAAHVRTLPALARLLTQQRGRPVLIATDSPTVGVALGTLVIPCAATVALRDGSVVIAHLTTANARRAAADLGVPGWRSMERCAACTELGVAAIGRYCPQCYRTLPAATALRRVRARVRDAYLLALEGCSERFDDAAMPITPHVLGAMQHSTWRDCAGWQHAGDTRHRAVLVPGRIPSWHVVRAERDGQGRWIPTATILASEHPGTDPERAYLDGLTAAEELAASCTDAVRRAAELADAPFTGDARTTEYAFDPVMLPLLTEVARTRSCRTSEESYD